MNSPYDLNTSPMKKVVQQAHKKKAPPISNVEPTRYTLQDFAEMMGIGPKHPGSCGKAGHVTCSSGEGTCYCATCEAGVTKSRQKATSDEDSILHEAEALVNGPRQQDYDTPKNNYRRLALMMSAILGIEVSPEKAALCMCAVKLCRESFRHKRDNLVDLAGYAWVVQEIAEERERSESNAKG